MFEKLLDAFSKNYVESKFLDQLLDWNHVLLCLAIFGFLYLAQKVKPIDDKIFQTNWKYIIPGVNLVLATLGVFLLKMTAFETMGGKVTIVILISAVTAFGYQSFAKPFEAFVKKIFGSKDDEKVQ